MSRMYGGPNADSLQPDHGPDKHHEQELLDLGAALSPHGGGLHSRRWSLAAAAGMIVITGLLVHFATEGVVGDFVGDALFAVMVYLALSFVFVRLPSWPVALITIVLCVGIEFFQLTGVPAVLAEAFPPVRLVLGTTFTAIDLAAYVVGAVATAAVISWRRLD
jgi:hypothetical protein